MLKSAAGVEPLKQGGIARPREVHRGRIELALTLGWSTGPSKLFCVPATQNKPTQSEALYSGA